MSRFANLPTPPKGARFANFSEKINAPLPGETAMVPSTDAKYAQRLPAFRPQVPASTARASASAAPAPAKPKAPIKSAAMIATEVYAERVVKVMNSTAAIGKKKSAAEMLGKTKATADEIIAKLASVETDAVQEQAAIDAMWTTAIASANARAGFPSDAPEPTKPAASSGDVWSKAIAKVNAANGFPADADGPEKSEVSANGSDNVWAKAIAKVNAMHGFSGELA